MCCSLSRLTVVVRQLVDMENTDFDHIVIGKYLHIWAGVKNVKNG
jgi:hypothetical protein